MSLINRTRDKRRHRRVPLSLAGRLMLTTRQEAQCRAVDMSPGGLSVETSVRVRQGERVVAYIDEIGRIEGFVARSTRTGFAMTIVATDRKRDKLADTLTFQANRDDHAIEMRGDTRKVVPGSRSEIVLSDGTTFFARLIDISASGGSAMSRAPLTVGMKVWIDGKACEVVRTADFEHAFRFV